MNGILVVLGIAGMFLLLIAPHEAGHFAFAKLFRVRVIEFSIGAGARLWSATRGGTLYAIRALPILGYVRMGGMEAGDFEDPNGFHRKPARQRLPRGRRRLEGRRQHQNGERADLWQSGAHPGRGRQEPWGACDAEWRAQ